MQYKIEKLLLEHKIKFGSDEFNELDDLFKNEFQEFLELKKNCKANELKTKDKKLCQMFWSLHDFDEYNSTDKEEIKKEIKEKQNGLTEEEADAILKQKLELIKERKAKKLRLNG